MNIQSKISSDIMGGNTLIKEYTQNYQELNLLTLEKKETLHLFQELVIRNKQTNIFPYNLLQRLWIKLIKKYKYKHQDWVNICPQHSLHFYLIDEAGDGLQSLIKFYQKRLLFEWKEDAFEYGLELFIDQKQCKNLEMFFLNSLICDQWEINYLANQTISKHFLDTKNSKVLELYESYQIFKKYESRESATLLYKLLKKYNPQYLPNSKSTPDFVKQLMFYVN